MYSNTRKQRWRAAHLAHSAMFEWRRRFHSNAWKRFQKKTCLYCAGSNPLNFFVFFLLFCLFFFQLFINIYYFFSIIYIITITNITYLFSFFFCEKKIKKNKVNTLQTKKWVFLSMDCRVVLFRHCALSALGKNSSSSIFFWFVLLFVSLFGASIANARCFFDFFSSRVVSRFASFCVLFFFLIKMISISTTLIVSFF